MPYVNIKLSVDLARYAAGFLTATFAEERRNDTLDAWIDDLIEALEKSAPEDE